jgi:hypothetical protein
MTHSPSPSRADIARLPDILAPTLRVSPPGVDETRNVGARYQGAKDRGAKDRGAKDRGANGGA